MSTKAVDWDYFISARGKGWRPSPIRGLYPLEQIPGMISFLAGKPNPNTFPFQSLSVELKTDDASKEPETLKIDAGELVQGLQYGPTAGLTALIKWIEELQTKVHGREKDGWRVSIGSGSQDLLHKAIMSMLNDGDSLLVETPVYPGLLGMLAPVDLNLIEIPVDHDGLDPAKLEETLANWDNVHAGKPFPKVLYTIPTGSNPTGCTAPIERRREVLRLAYKYNLIIVEDDAYFFLHFHPEKRPLSYFTLDQGGSRVVRLDTMSKILSSGMRIGFMTAPTPLTDVVDLNTANTNLQPNSTTQALVLALLRHWGHDNFLAHTRRVAGFYDQQRANFEAAAHKHLDGLATWVSPDCGMFLFIKLLLKSDDGSDGDSYEVIRNKAVEKGFLALPGVAFMPSASKSPYVRVSYSLSTAEQADEAFRRLRSVLLEARGASQNGVAA